jgi:hypothetical protein
MSAEWAVRDEQPIQPTSTNQMTLFATVNLSLLDFPPKYPNFIEPFLCQKTSNLTMWRHMATMALRGLRTLSLVHHAFWQYFVWSKIADGMCSTSLCSLNWKITILVYIRNHVLELPRDKQYNRTDSYKICNHSVVYLYVLKFAIR